MTGLKDNHLLLRTGYAMFSWKILHIILFFKSDCISFYLKYTPITIGQDGFVPAGFFFLQKKLVTV